MLVSTGWRIIVLFILLSLAITGCAPQAPEPSGSELSGSFKVIGSNPKTITRATRLLWVAHNLERSADRVTNICERVVFTVTGKMYEIGASRY